MARNINNMGISDRFDGVETISSVEILDIMVMLPFREFDHKKVPKGLVKLEYE